MSNLRDSLFTAAKDIEDSFIEDVEQQVNFILNDCKTYYNTEPKLVDLVKLALERCPTNSDDRDEHYFMCEGMHQILKAIGYNEVNPIETIQHFISYYILDDGEIHLTPIEEKYLISDNSYIRYAKLDIDLSQLFIPHGSTNIYNALERYARLALEVYKENEAKDKELFGG